MKFKMTKIAAASVLAAASFASVNAHAVAISSGVFNMYASAGWDQAGVVPGGTFINADSSITGFIDTGAGTWGVASTAPFFGFNWTASNGVLIQTAGNYVLDTATGHISLAAPGTNANDGQMHFTVGAGQVAGAIDFAWSATTGIRVIDVWDVTTDAAGTHYTAVVAPGMENGPFPGYNAAFSMTAPVPEASTYGMMLAGLGLVGFAVRRRKLVA